MDKQNKLQESINQLSELPKSPKLVSIPESASTVEKIKNLENN